MTAHIPAPRVPGDLTAAQYAALALMAHQLSCKECGNPQGDSWCPQGERYLAAVQPDRSWIRDAGSI